MAADVVEGGQIPKRARDHFIKIRQMARATSETIAALFYNMGVTTTHMQHISNNYEIMENTYYAI